MPNIEFAEVLWVFSSYAGVFLLHTFRRSVPVTKPSFRLQKYVLVLCHLSIPVMEICRYHLRALHGTPGPSGGDFLLCVLHSFTAFALTSRLRVGDRSIARPTYQTITTMRFCLSAAAYLTGDPFLYRASIRVINGFVYPRIGIKLLNQMRILPSYSAVYTASNFVASMLSIHETQLIFGPHAYLAIFAAIVVLNRYVAEQVQKP
ncbi:uncharacterized protein B0I36DRAFT_300057 [Microdochium trichocladiopsis]|uniref:Uncharacterized protein n=1 Tax=Microdochium trichocladiopsis TaxID=1682393 RepID=A0A9P9BL06_9PEZI|nr:uncharacterized protein B0I36DRAFT_300057 [Microdochium trichocladiopsis]KAH7012198.1 hypothetical protein B0I36DRAFT_300057 [Microdochium trichocladiopsis]